MYFVPEPTGVGDKMPTHSARHSPATEEAEGWWLLRAYSAAEEEMLGLKTRREPAVCRSQRAQRVVVLPGPRLGAPLRGEALGRQGGSAERPFYMNRKNSLEDREQAECRNQETVENTHYHIHAVRLV